MSRAGKREDREPGDFYASPPQLAGAICDLLDTRGIRPATVIEPSAGHGSFVNAARVTWLDAHLIAVELDAAKAPQLGVADTVVCGDWIDVAPKLSARRPVLIIGNPPYSSAESHIRAALDTMAPGDALAFLLRINFFGSLGRVSFWRDTPLAWMAPVVPRPSFTADGRTDGTEYAVFSWRKGHVGSPTIFDPLVWRVA